jgi:hypothetical protein
MSSDEQQPAEYRRTDPKDEPRTPAGQQAAIEGMLAARDMTPLDRFQAHLLDSVKQFERERRAEIIAAGGDPDDDRDPLDLVRSIADDYARHKEQGDEALADFLNLLATEVLDIEDVRDIRLAAEATAAITPRLICESADRGMPPASIAATLGVSDGYVYRILRKRDAQ